MYGSDRDGCSASRNLPGIYPVRHAAQKVTESIAYNIDPVPSMTWDRLGLRLFRCRQYRLVFVVPVHYCAALGILKVPACMHFGPDFFMTAVKAAACFCDMLCGYCLGSWRPIGDLY